MLERKMASFKKCPWTHQEDMQLVSYISRYGIWNWSQMPKHAGLSRSGKSCRLRWLNYLNPEIKRGNYTPEEDDIIIDMRRNFGAGWSAIAAMLPGRTDNEIKNRWHTHLKKRFANNLVQVIEPRTEELKEEEIDTPSAYDNCSSSSSPITQNFQENFYDYNPMISSSMLEDINASSNNIVPPTYGTSTDPHTIFWRQPFSAENVYEDPSTTYDNPEFELPVPQGWFQETFNQYDDSFNSSDNYWLKLLTIGEFEDHHHMMDNTVISKLMDSEDKNYNYKNKSDDV